MPHLNSTKHFYHDSRQITPGDVFVSLPGAERFEADALANGASEIKRMTRAEMAVFANDVYGRPSDHLKVVGVTGTNGKTTVCHLVAQGLTGVGYNVAVLGTLNSSLTTPESLDIQRLMEAHLAQGGTHFVMEASSHGIDQGRLDAIRFDVKLLTNITRDHLDYHGSIAEYAAVKMRFLNDWPGTRFLPEDYEGMGLDFAIPLMGDFNQKNMRAAVAILRELGLSETQISTQMSACSAPPGRFEGIFEGQPFLVMVDYAHTPDSLANVLQTARRIADDRTGRLICVFGCGGDRDRGKRPEMGQEAAKYSDYFVVTADNPRSESQTQITADILAGLQTVTTPYVVLEDRESAIMHAVQNAKEHDVVVVAGKGHETYQILADKTIHFDDREMVRDAIRRVRPVSL